MIEREATRRPAAGGVFAARAVLEDTGTMSPGAT